MRFDSAALVTCAVSFTLYIVNVKEDNEIVNCFIE